MSSMASEDGGSRLGGLRLRQNLLHRQNSKIRGRVTPEDCARRERGACRRQLNDGAKAAP
jgi:hypothetical protein